MAQQKIGRHANNNTLFQKQYNLQVYKRTPTRIREQNQRFSMHEIRRAIFINNLCIVWNKVTPILNMKNLKGFCSFLVLTMFQVDRSLRKRYKMLEIIEGAIQNGQSKETGNMWYTRRRQTRHNTEKLVTCGTQDEDKQNTTQRNWQHVVHKTKTNKTKTQHNMCWTPLYVNKQIQITYVRHEPSYKQLEVNQIF